MTAVEIVFDNPEQAKAFMAWFDNSGEQQYFQSDADTVCEFIYDYNHLRIRAVGCDE